MPGFKLKRQRSIDRGTKQRNGGSVHAINMSELMQDKAAFSNEQCKEEDNRTPQDLVVEGRLVALRAAVEDFELDLSIRDSDGSTLLHTAVKHDQIEIVYFLVEKGINLNATDRQGNTALHYAARFQNMEAVRLLLSCDGIKSDILNSDNETAFHLAVRSLNKDLVRIFAEDRNVDITKRGKRGRTVLHVAAELDFVEGMKAMSEAVKEIAEKYGDEYRFRLCAKDDDGITAMHFAARCGSAATLEYIIEVCKGHGYPVETILSFIDEENSTPLHAAVGAGHVGVVEVLLKHGACCCFRKGDQVPPIHVAVSRGDLAIVRLMVHYANNTEILKIEDKYGSSLLHKAVITLNSSELIEYLLSNGCDPNKRNEDGLTPLHVAISSNNGIAVKLLLANGAKISIKNKRQQNAFCYAAFRNRPTFLEMMCNHCTEASITELDVDSKNAIYYAVLKGSTPCIIRMMTKMIGFENARDGHGNNIIHVAAFRGDALLLTFVLGMDGASVCINEPNLFGMTPLHQVAHKGHKECCEVLLSHGAMIHRCSSGYSPFLGAAAYNQVEVMKILLEASPYQLYWANNEGNTGLHLAAKKGYCDVVKYCLDTGMPIVHNHAGESFMDIAIQSNQIKVATVAIKHDRWEECLDLHSPHHPCPMIRLVEHMPSIAEMVLDRCKKVPDCDSSQKDYFEEYNFKYLLNPEDVPQEIMKYSSNAANEGSTMASLMPDEINMSSYTQAQPAPRKDSKSYLPLATLRSMCHFKRRTCISHPVVKMFLRSKWRKYGRAFNLFELAVYIIYLVFFTSFIAVTPPPWKKQQLSLNASNNCSAIVGVAPTYSSSCDSVMLSAQEFVLLSLSLASVVVNTIFWVLRRLAIYRRGAFFLSWSLIVELSAYVCSTIFTVLFLKEIQVWELGVFAILFSWLAFIFRLEFFALFGTYIFMIVDIFNTLLRVMLVGLLFIVAFGLCMYILVGEKLFYGTPALSMYLIFAAFIGEFSYEHFISDIDSLIFPILTFFFIILIALLLTIAVSNLLVGLAVGDIEGAQKNAIFTQRNKEVRYYTGLDPILYWCCKKYFLIHSRRVEPNAPRNIVRRLWHWFWRLLASNFDAQDSFDSNDQTREMVKDLHDEVRNLREEISKFTKLQYNRFKPQDDFQKRVDLFSLTPQEKDGLLQLLRRNTSHSESNDC